MNRKETEKIIESVKKALEILERRGLEGDVYGLDNESISYEIKKGEISDAVRNEKSGLGIRVLKDNKIGFGYTVPGEEEKGVRKAEELLPLSEEVEMALPSTGNAPDVKTYHNTLAEKIRDREGIELAAEVIEGCTSVSDDITPTRGEVSMMLGSKVIGNTEGTFFEKEATLMTTSVSATLSTEQTSLSASESETSRKADLNTREIGKSAGRKVDSMRERTKYSTGKKSVMIEPDGLAQLLSFALLPALHGDNVRKGKSVYEGKLGEKVADTDLKLVEDPTLDWGLGSGGFDDEGVVSRQVPLISKGGKLQNFLYNLKEAGKSETESTGNGVRGSFMSPPDIDTRNLLLKGKEKERNELLQDSSVLIDNIMGAHTSNPVSGEFSVVINPGWNIEKEEKQGRLDGAMLSGNLPETLQKIELGKDYKKVSMGTISIELPSALMRDVTVSGRGK